MSQESTPRSYHLHFIIIFLMISFNLRMSFSAADPLLVFLMRDLGLDIADSSLFALLPVIVLGIAAPLGATLSPYIRPRLLILYALLLAIAGVFWRSYGGIPGLFGGTACIGLGLGVTGSVILGLVKELFPGQVPELMGGYTACVCLGTAVGSGASDPIAMALGGWREGLLFWVLPLILATALWLELIMRNHPANVARTTVKSSMRPLMHQRKAWDVSLFYLFRVAGAWLLVVWLATLLRQRGLPLVEAGIVLAVATACEIPAALLSHQVAQWLGSTKRLMYVCIPTSALACWGLLLGPLNWWPLFAIIFGLGIGFIFTLGMTLIVASSTDERSTIALSGMGQGIGFIAGGCLAWAASFAMKWPHNHLWISLIYTIFALSGLYFGIRCTRPGTVSVTNNAPPSV